ncbi:MAG: hypothetical protein WCI71_02000, partial [Bacteroidota bacterium]
MNKTVFRIFFFFMVLSSAFFSEAQDIRSTVSQDTPMIADSCLQKDIFDVLFRKKIIDNQIPSRKVRAIILPLIGVSPTTGFQIGAGSSVSWQIGKHPDTKLSAGVISLMVTAKKQLIFQLKTNMFLNRNTWFAQTDWRVYLYRMPTFGLGTGPSDNIPVVPGDPSDLSSIYQLEGEYPMRFNWIKFHNVLSRAIPGHLFVGVGYHLDYHFRIADIALNTDSGSFTT